MRLDEKIRKLRTDAGLSQQQLADALMVSRAAVAKWENGNGTPDVENLKTLAAYFHCDLDRLLYDSMDLQQNGESNSYCGKNCDACTYREQRNCPGCSMGPAAPIYQGCAISTCCKRQHHNSCHSCSRKEECSLLQTRTDMPVLFDRWIREQKQRKEALRRKKIFCGKWTWVLFWMSVPEIFVGFILAEQVAYQYPSLHVLGNILDIAISVAYGIILLLLSTHNKDFKIAGYYAMVMSCYSLLIFLFGGVSDPSDSNMFFLLLISPISIVYAYYFCRGYAGVLEDVDWELSEKWKNLWKALLIAFSSLIGSTMLGVIHIIPPLMALLIFVSVFAIVVIGVLRIVYIYKTAKAFCTANF